MTTSPRPPASTAARRRSGRASFPVTVTQLPVARCSVCGRSLAYRKGEISAVLTSHYGRDHPDLLGG